MFKIVGKPTSHLPVGHCENDVEPMSNLTKSVNRIFGMLGISNVSRERVELSVTVAIVSLSIVALTSAVIGSAFCPGYLSLTFKVSVLALSILFLLKRLMDKIREKGADKVLEDLRNSIRNFSEIFLSLPRKLQRCTTVFDNFQMPRQRKTI